MRTQRDLLIDKLIERLDYDDPTTRRNAVGALRLHGERARAAAPALERLLDDPSPIVRAEARRTLDQLGGSSKVA
ncbi:MAG: HEAT repeat domain-containing protein [Pirellulales bacterium]|nr:HEAT repeat domain-containing protein [Pirellulales bacterium]